MARCKQIEKKSAGVPIKEIPPQEQSLHTSPENRNQNDARFNIPENVLFITNSSAKASELNSLYIEEKDQTTP
jgi:hypothetical protein